MDKCTVCGTPLEDVVQEQSRQILSALPNESGGYDVEGQVIVYAGWCPKCQTTRRIEVKDRNFDSAVQW